MPSPPPSSENNSAESNNVNNNIRSDKQPAKQLPAVAPPTQTNARLVRSTGLQDPKASTVSPSIQHANPTMPEPEHQLERALAFINAKVHPTAVVDPRAEIGAGCVIGPFCVVGPLVKMGQRNVLRPHAVIVGATTIGDDNQFSSHCVIGEQAENYTVPIASEDCATSCTNLAHGGGKLCDSQWDACTYEPMRSDGGEESNPAPPKITIGHRNVFREFVNVHEPEGEPPMYGTTIIGNDCYLMSYAHVAHDNVLQDRVTLACGVVLGGYTRVLHHSNIGLNATVHQFSTIGAFAMVAMGTVVDSDVLPFTLYSSRNGFDARSEGLNSVALSRAGISATQQSQLERWYLTEYRNAHAGKLVGRGSMSASSVREWFHGDLEDFDAWRARQKRVRPLGAFASGTTANVVASCLSIQNNKADVESVVVVVGGGGGGGSHVSMPGGLDDGVVCSTGRASANVVHGGGVSGNCPAPRDHHNGVQTYVITEEADCPLEREMDDQTTCNDSIRYVRICYVCNVFCVCYVLLCYVMFCYLMLWMLCFVMYIVLCKRIL
jgi:UDP-N-acetylglucosamine acyltransferase